MFLLAYWFVDDILILNIWMIVIFRYVQNHYMQNLNQTPNYDYLGHPLNAYHLIRHLASGWNYLTKKQRKGLLESDLEIELGRQKICEFKNYLLAFIGCTHSNHLIYIFAKISWRIHQMQWYPIYLTRKELHLELSDYGANTSKYVISLSFQSVTIAIKNLCE